MAIANIFSNGNRLDIFFLILGTKKLHLLVSVLFDIKLDDIASEKGKKKIVGM